LELALSDLQFFTYFTPADKRLLMSNLPIPEMGKGMVREREKMPLIPCFDIYS
jgi:hypothetical protein